MKFIFEVGLKIFYNITFKFKSVYIVRISLCTVTTFKFEIFEQIFEFCREFIEFNHPYELE